MNSKTRLILVALGSALVSAGCFSGAYALASANDSGSSEIVSREIPWDGSTSLSLGVRSEVRYVQTPGEGRVVARGPHRSVSTLVVRDGDIHDGLLHSGATVEIVVSAPAISRFQLNGGSRLSIENYDQQSLSVSTEGKAQVEVTGRADSVSVNMQGSGMVNLARLAAGTASVDIGGMSTLVLAPSHAADLKVRNFASAVLLSQPAALTSKLEDSGRVVNAAP